MIKKILVPLDGSKTAETVLPLVTHLAKANDAEVDLITVMTPVAIWDTVASMMNWEAEEKAARDYIRGKTVELTEAGLTVHSKIAFGPAADAIYDAAKERKVDFIVMTTHGRSGVARFVLGSVADKLLHTVAPLLVVRPGDEAGGELTPAGIRKILVPLDGSDIARSAIPHAEEMATRFNASLIFCQVATTDWIAYSGMETPILYQEVLEDMKANAKTNTEEAADKSRARGFDVECVVGIGGPADEIQRIATEQGADMIVMSTHGRSGPSRWVMGSTADALVRRTHLPCLLIRPQHAKHEVEPAVAEHAAIRPRAG
jgi:nucleotide-binding universal stress UspA family protein